MKTTSKLIIFIFTLLALSASAYAADDSPLFEAVKKGDKAAVEALLEKGADINAKDAYGYTPLQWAVINKRKDIVDLLLTKGADANAKDKSRNIPLVRAANDGSQDIAELLLAKRADVNAKGEYGDTPLHEAASRGYKNMVELLLAKGADVNAKANGGSTPLHNAAYWGRTDIAVLLLAKGADANAKHSGGGTPLWEAVRSGEGYHKDIVALLLAKGADVNAKYRYGVTLLHEAALSPTKDAKSLNNDTKEIVEMLLAKGADVNAKTTEGETPLFFWAMANESNEKNDILELIEEYILKPAKSNPRAALTQMTAQLKDKPDDKTGTRRLIIKLANEIKPAPAIPEEARKHFVEGTAIVKAAKNPAQQALAAQSFSEALKVAPWWGDAYYNLGVAQELAEKYDDAEKAFSFYLLTNASATEKREVQDRIYALSAKRKLLGAK